MEDVVHVVAFDRNTGRIRASMSCDRDRGSHYAQYYRSIGYKARIVELDDMEAVLEKDSLLRAQQIQEMRDAGMNP